MVSTRWQQKFIKVESGVNKRLFLSRFSFLQNVEFKILKLVLKIQLHLKLLVFRADLKKKNKTKKKH